MPRLHILFNAKVDIDSEKLAEMKAKLAAGGMTGFDDPKIIQLIVSEAREEGVTIDIKRFTIEEVRS